MLISSEDISATQTPAGLVSKHFTEHDISFYVLCSCTEHCESVIQYLIFKDYHFAREYLPVTYQLPITQFRLK